MEQRTLSTRELQELENRLFFHFGMSKNYQQEYSRNLKGLYSHRTLLQVLKEKAEDYNARGRDSWPTCEEIVSAYWAKIKNPPHEAYSGNCVHCQGTGYVISVADAHKHYNRKMDGIVANDSLAIDYLVCPCPYGTDRLKPENKDIITKELRSKYVNKYGIGPLKNNEAIRLAEGYIRECCKLLHSQKEQPQQNNEQEMAKDWNETVRRQAI